jgi:hypothetical protein
LTASANAALSVDGVAVVSGDRIIVKNQATAANNGIYTVTNTGSAGTLWVLTRATDANSPGIGNPAKLGSGSFALATAGNTLANTGWLVNSTVGAIGTDAVNWVQYSATTSGVVSLNGLAGAVNLVSGQGINVDPSGANITITGAMAPPQGRLTLQAHTPVMTTNQTAKSTIFYDCYRGGSVPVFDGTRDALLAIPSCEISTVLQASGAGVVNASGVFDVWAVNVSGTLHLCVATNGSGGGWGGDTGGSNTVRGSGYSALNNFTRPYITNAVALTNCYEGSTQRGTIAINQATYLGSLWSTAAGQTSFSFGTSGAPPTPACLCLWNYYSRVDASVALTDTRFTWSYNGLTREADGANNAGAYRINALVGVSEQNATVQYSDLAQQLGSGGVGQLGVCFDTTTAFASNSSVGWSQGYTNGAGNSATGFFISYATGFHFYSACESTGGSAAQTFSGNFFSQLVYRGWH